MLREAMILFSAMISMGNIQLNDTTTIWNTGVIAYTEDGIEHCYEIDSNDENDGKLLAGMDEVVQFAKYVKENN